jgi:hypothetical protein
VKTTLWTLSGFDLTLGGAVSGEVSGASSQCLVARVRASRAGTDAFSPVSCSSGHHLDVGAGESDRWRSAEEVEREGRVDGDLRSDTACPTSGRCDLRIRSPCEGRQWEANDSILWGLLYKPYGRLLLILLAIFIDIAT